MRDVEANIEDEKEHMSEDNYEDTIDVLGMLKGNLQKVGEHGQNTTRTLKAMEEMLRDRSGGIVKADVTTLFKHNQSMVDNYYGKQIAAQHINVVFDYPSEPIFVNANPELLSKVFMSLLGNSLLCRRERVHERQRVQPRSVSQGGSRSVANSWSSPSTIMVSVSKRASSIRYSTPSLPPRPQAKPLVSAYI